MSEEQAPYMTQPRAHPRGLSLALRCKAIARSQRRTASTIQGNDAPSAKARVLLKRCASQFEELGRNLQLTGGKNA